MEGPLPRNERDLLRQESDLINFRLLFKIREVG
jgi:hypothetical protein